jgi:hypothetical protein
MLRTIKVNAPNGAARLAISTACATPDGTWRQRFRHCRDAVPSSHI